MKAKFSLSISTLKIFSIITLLIFMSSCFPKKALVNPHTVILPLGDTILITDGSLVYALPLTVFEITLEVEKKIEKPGPYARYAADMLGIKDVISQEKESWAISSVIVRTMEELDPSEFFVVQSNTLVQSNALALKKSGLIMDINPSLYDKETFKINSTSKPDSKIQYLDLGADEYFVSQSDTAYKLVKLDTSFIKIPYLVEKKKQLTLEQMADKAAKTLLELRDGKHLILTGEATVFPQDRAAIDEMNRLEREYTALFAGKTITEKKTFRYTFIPQKEMAGKTVTLFRFSDLNGVMDESSADGVPVTVLMEPAKKTKDLTIVSRPKQEGAPTVDFDKLYYRVPDVVTLTFKSGNQIYYNSRKLIYQFGEVIQLPANFIIGR